MFTNNNKNTMSKSNQNRNGSMTLFLCACVTVTIIAIKYAPKDPSPLEIEPQEVVHEFPEPTLHRYKCGNFGSLRHCPEHKQKGREIPEKTAKKLRELMK
tara:strand:+ start:186 stop:485 length:300 start_codon:yes stop_codon:yes gene_type:complete